MNELTTVKPRDVAKKLKLRPKQISFLENYYSKESDTFGNVYRSALKAGFKESYARVMTTEARNYSWLTQAKAYLTRLDIDHIRLSLEEEATKATQARDRIKALELLGKDAGMFIDRSVSQVNVSFTNSVPRPTIIEGEIIQEGKVKEEGSTG